MDHGASGGARSTPSGRSKLRSRPCKRRVILIFNGIQIEDIDAPLVIMPVSEARFLRLVPLAGG